MSFPEILKYGFLVIFFATAVLGIASLPNWIEIPEWYKKKIFLALILEVVGVILILFNQEVGGTDSTVVPEIAISKSGWIALDKSGAIIHPRITVSTKDTSITYPLGEQSFSEFQNVSGKLSENGLSVISAKGTRLATISTSALKQNGLFNSFKTASGEITSTKNYAYIQWEKRSNRYWERKGEFLAPFELEIVDNAGGTFYQIRNVKEDTVVFNSESSSKNLISVDNRIIHFLKDEKVYYLLRIAWADLESDKKYVHVINARIEPIVSSGPTLH